MPTDFPKGPYLADVNTAISLALPKGRRAGVCQTICHCVTPDMAVALATVLNAAEYPDFNPRSQKDPG